MSLTWKLCLGFLFALVLQVVQMLISVYFTTKVQNASVQVSSALSASIALQLGLDAVANLRARIVTDKGRGGSRIDTKVSAVYLDEVEAQSGVLHRELAGVEVATLAQVSERLAKARRELDALESLSKAGAAAGGVEHRDALDFFDDAVLAVQEALGQTQISVRAVGEAGVQIEREVHDLPVQAGLAVTFGGVVLMVVFIVWFSRQLVIPIQRAWAELERRVAERTAELATTVTQLEGQIIERQRAEAQKEELHQKLVETSRRAGMAELANGVLHNVGNVLNSVNVSANLLLERLRRSKADGLQRVVKLLHEHQQDLGEFLMRSPQGQKLPNYLEQLAAHLLQERDGLVGETHDLSQRIDHMKEIVNRQQSYARVTGVTTVVHLSAIVDDVLRMHALSFQQSDIRIETRFDWDEECEVDRSRVLQILMNLVTNAKHAVQERHGGGGWLRVVVQKRTDERLELAVTDNGVGIGHDNLAKIFAHGFTTKRDGHGFGLHHSANAAAEMGGRLWAESDGVGTGATFRLELPVRPSARSGGGDTAAAATGTTTATPVGATA